MHTIEQAFSLDIADEARRWAGCWQAEALAERTRIRFSKRMFRSIGRCAPARCLVSLAVAVQEMPRQTVLEVLCHELAHIAAYEHYGPRIRPHGHQWQALMRQAGHEPRVRFDDESMIQLLEARAIRPRRYLHRCPRCRSSRVSARRMTRWRCGPCYELGYDGRIDIFALEDR